MTPTSTYKGVVKQIHRTARELPALTRSVGEAVSELASTEAKRREASDELEARAALALALEALDADPQPGGEAQRRRRAGLAKKLAVLRSIESDARLEDREAWALSLVELSRARVRKAVSELDAALRTVLEGGALRILQGERAAPSFALGAG
jgi:vacuolar-type H+-ATPase subunit I/STV1